MNVTLDPEQILDVGAPEMVTEGVTVPPTWITDAAEVAVGADAHGSLEVITTVTWSLFASVVEVKVEEVCPATATPLTCH